MHFLAWFCAFKCCLCSAAAWVSSARVSIQRNNDLTSTVPIGKRCKVIRVDCIQNIGWIWDPWVMEFRMDADANALNNNFLLWCQGHVPCKWPFFIHSFLCNFIWKLNYNVIIIEVYNKTGFFIGPVAVASSVQGEVIPFNMLSFSHFNVTNILRSAMSVFRTRSGVML